MKYLHNLKYQYWKSKEAGRKEKKNLFKFKCLLIPFHSRLHVLLLYPSTTTTKSSESSLIFLLCNRGAVCKFRLISTMPILQSNWGKQFIIPSETLLREVLVEVLNPFKWHFKTLRVVWMSTHFCADLTLCHWYH